MTSARSRWEGGLHPWLHGGCERLSPSRRHPLPHDVLTFFGNRLPSLRKRVQPLKAILSGEPRRCISSIIGGDEITCLAGLPGAAKAGIMALDPCNFPVLEPRATCLKTLTGTASRM